MSAVEDLPTSAETEAADGRFFVPKSYSEMEIATAKVLLSILFESPDGEDYQALYRKGLHCVVTPDGPQDPRAISFFRGVTRLEDIKSHDIDHFPGDQLGVG